MAVVAKGAIIRERVVSFLFSLHSVAVVGDHEGEGGIFLVLAALGLALQYDLLEQLDELLANSRICVSCSGYTRARPLIEYK